MSADNKPFGKTEFTRLQVHTANLLMGSPSVEFIGPDNRAIGITQSSGSSTVITLRDRSHQVHPQGFYVYPYKNLLVASSVGGVEFVGMTGHKIHDLHNGTLVDLPNQPASGNVNRDLQAKGNDREQTIVEIIDPVYFIDREQRLDPYGRDVEQEFREMGNVDEFRGLAESFLTISEHNRKLFEVDIELPDYSRDDLGFKVFHARVAEVRLSHEIVQVKEVYPIESREKGEFRVYFSKRDSDEPAHEYLIRHGRLGVIKPTKATSQQYINPVSADEGDAVLAKLRAAVIRA